MSNSHTRKQAQSTGTTCAESEARLAAALDRAGLQARLIPLAGPRYGGLDQLLLDDARAHGAEVREEHAVTGVESLRSSPRFLDSPRARPIEAEQPMRDALDRLGPVERILGIVGQRQAGKG